MPRRGWLAGISLSVLLLLVLWTSSLIVSAPLSQVNSTEQQQTIDALVQQRLQQTVTVQQQYSDMLTNDALAIQAVTVTAAFDATLNAAVAQAAAATAGAPLTQSAATAASTVAAALTQRAATAQARGLTFITPANAQSMTQLAAITTQAAVVTSVAFSPDSTILAVAGMRDEFNSGSGGLWLWDSATGAPRTTLKQDTSAVYAVSFSPDGQTLAVAAQDGLTLWDVAADTQIDGVAGFCSGVAFSPDGQTLAAACNDQLQLLDMGTGAARASVNSGNVRDIVWSPDGQIVAWGDESDTVLWDGTAYFPTVLYYTVSSVAFSPDGQTLAAGGSEVWLFDVGAGNPRGSFEYQNRSNGGVAFSPDGAILAFADGGAVDVIDNAAGVLLTSLGEVADSRGYSMPAAFSPDGTILADAVPGGMVRLWGMRTNS